MTAAGTTQQKSDLPCCLVASSYWSRSG